MPEEELERPRLSRPNARSSRCPPRRATAPEAGRPNRLAQHTALTAMRPD
jgi:hypothetical protein